MEKEELFEQRKILKKEGESISDRKIIRDRIEKVDDYIRINDPIMQKYWWGEGIKKSYPQAFDEIESIFKDARYEAHHNYGNFGMLDKMRRAFEPIENPEIKKNRQLKYKASCRKFLYNKFSQEAITAKNAFEERKGRLERNEKFDESMIDTDFQFKLAFEEFFEPVLKYEETKQKLEEKIEELTDSKKELGQEYISIGQDKSLIKSERKRKQTELQPKIIELKKELEPLESKLKNLSKAKIILINNFIPDYQKGEELEPVLEKMYDKFSKKFKKEYS